VVDGDNWKMTSTSTFTTWVCEFKIGEPKEQKTADGRTLMSTFTFTDGKLVEEQKKISEKDKDSHIEVGKLDIF